MDKIIIASHASGNLNLNGRSLDSVPIKVFRPLDNLHQDEKWFEVVPLKKLELRHNNISELQEDLGELIDLTWLDLDGNKLSELPASIAKLDQLKLLNICANKFTKLPDELGHCSALVSLLADGNALEEVPECIGGCVNLTELKVSKNKITKLPPQLAQCRLLRKLEIQGNMLVELLPEALGSLANLIELDASQNRLEALPSSISNLKKLVRLDVHGNKLSSIHPAVGGCCSLVEAFFGYNNLVTLPSELSSLTALHTLDARDNKVKDLPAGLCSLQLHTLDLRNNDLSALPPELGRMTSLRGLYLDGNSLRTIRSALLRQGKTGDLLEYLRSRLADVPKEEKRVAPASGNLFGEDSSAQLATAMRQAQASQALNLSRRKLSAVPEGLHEMDPQLTSLDLSFNQIQTLPAELGQCTALQTLVLSGNCLQEWPAVLNGGGLSRLQELCLTKAFAKDFKQLPSSAFACLPSLRQLQLGGSALRLPLPPTTFTELPRLEELHLGGMNLGEFPLSLLELSKLRVLDLSGNGLTLIPEAISRLTTLEELDVSNNDLTALPPQLGLLEDRLRSLKLEGNPLRSIRRPVIERGTKAVLEYLKQKLPQPS